MVDIFRGLGVEAVPTVGHQFDPEVHEAVMQEEAADVTDGEVLKEFRKGFTMKGRLLRPAMVVVCTNDAMPYVPPAAEEEGKDEGEADASAEREAEGDEKEAKEEEEAKQ